MLDALDVGRLGRDALYLGVLTARRIKPLSRLEHPVRDELRRLLSGLELELLTIGRLTQCGERVEHLAMSRDPARLLPAYRAALVEAERLYALLRKRRKTSEVSENFGSLPAGSRSAREITSRRSIRVDLSTRIAEITGELGADFFGIADLTPARDAIIAQGGPALGEYPRSVSVGIALMHAIVDQLPRRAERPVAMLYKHHAYDLVNNRLDHIASRVAGAIQRAGHRAMPAPASQTVDDERLCGLISHKLAAHMAGLGWIGRSCMLVTPTNGPRARWATILTDAPLDPTGEPMAPRCGDCHACVDACPPRAFTGRLFSVDEPREARFAAEKCKAYFDHMDATAGIAVCGMCLYSCPHGREGSR